MHNKMRCLLYVFIISLCSCDFHSDAEGEKALMHIVRSYFYNHPEGYIPSVYIKEYLIPMDTKITSTESNSIGQIIFTNDKCVIVKDNYESIHLFQIGKKDKTLTPAQEQTYLLKDKPIKTYYIQMK